MELRRSSTTVVLGVLMLPLVGCADLPDLGLLDPEFPEFPTAPSSSDTYARETPHSWSRTSRYVLHEDGTFELQYLSSDSGFHPFTGSYSRSGPLITFDFDLASTAGATTAKGSLDGRRLRVEYNTEMWLSDFENGEYVLQQ